METSFPANSRIFITGGTGFFGKWLLTALRKMHEQDASSPKVLVLSRSPERFFQQMPEYATCSWLEIITGNLLDLDSALPATEFTHVIHAASDSSDLVRTAPLEWFEQSVAATRRILDFAHRAKAKKFLLTSSGAVYGPQPETCARLAENYTGAPAITDLAGVYGHAKRVAEQLCVLYHQQHDMQCTIARCFAFAGEYLPLDGSFALGNFVLDALKHPSIHVQGDGTPVRSYLHGQDLADWLLAILENGRPADPYNVGSDQSISMADLAMLVGQLIAPEKPVVIAKARPDYAGRSRYVPDITKARDELGLRVDIPLNEAILRMARHATRT